MRKVLILLLLLVIVGCQTILKKESKEEGKMEIKSGLKIEMNELIDKSDAIVILRIDEHIDIRKKPSLYTTHSCHIYQTLKGDIQKNAYIPMALLDTRTNFETPFSIDSTHLMFLRKMKIENESAEYYTMQIEGANIKLSPFGHEKLPKGKNIKEKIRNLIKESIKYFDKENEKEKEFLNRVIKYSK